MRHGSLDKYLKAFRKSGKKILKHPPHQGSPATSGDDLTLTELLTYAYQVVKGMLHLLEKNVGGL